MLPLENYRCIVDFENFQKALHNVATNPQPNLFGKSIEYYTFEGLTPYLPFPANVITANLWLFRPGIYGNLYEFSKQTILAVPESLVQSNCFKISLNG